MARVRTPVKKSVTAQERRDIAERYGCRCGESVEAPCIYCGRPGTINWVAQPRGQGWVQFDGLEIEHRVPEAQGGGGGRNLDVACLPCNRAKGPRTYAEWRGAA